MANTSTKNSRARSLALGGMLSALSAILMFFSFNVPFVPSFLKIDFSELPALIGAYALGPIAGAAICLVKNLINVLFTTTGGVGELSNFILGVCLVVPAGLAYKRMPSRKGAFIGGLIGAVVMAGLSLITNYYIVYPVYAKIMPIDVILDMYKAINPSVDSLWDALVVFNLPFTFIKGMISVLMCAVVYKSLAKVISA